MTGIYEFEGWAARIIRAYHEPPINAFRVLALGLDGSNAVAIKVFPDGALLVTGGTGGGGGDGAILDGAVSSIKATVFDLANSNPLTTALVDANGDQITSFGGGVQYTEGDTDASITGTAAMWEDAADTLRAISMAKPLPVQPGTAVTFPVTGTVTSTIAAMPAITGIVTANVGVGTQTVAGIVTANAGLGTFQVAGTVTATIAAMPAITGIVTVNIATGNVQYTEGDVDTSVTGTAIMWRDGSDQLLPVTETYPLPIQGTLSVSLLGVVQPEEGVAANGDGGIPCLAVRNDTPVSRTGSDGLYSWISVDDKGRVRITGDAGMGPLLVTVTGQLSTEALYATHVSTGINLTSTTVWTVAISTPSTHWRHFEFVNTTDTDIQLSFDGGTTKHRTYPAAYAGSLDLKANDLHETGFIAIRNDGAAPTRGKVYVHASGT